LNGRAGCAGFVEEAACIRNEWRGPRGPQGKVAEKNLAGGFMEENPAFRAVAANIAPDRETGIGAWSDAEIARAIREGIRRDGRVMGPPMPFELYRKLSDADTAAIIAYLRTIPPQD
jgi:hypothetical protein